MNYLAISHSYTQITIGLFVAHKLVDQKNEDNKLIAKKFVIHLDALLKRHAISLSDISFIAVNQGPGPFTTLRSILASVNGINLATHIPLIGVDGIHALLEEHRSPLFPHTVALMNAFNQEVYFGIQAPHQEVKTGYESATTFFTQLKTDFPENNIRFVGNGTEMYRDTIVSTFGTRAYIPEPLPRDPSITQIARKGLEKLNKQETTNQLFPLYLKKLNYKKSTEL